LNGSRRSFVLSAACSTKAYGGDGVGYRSKARRERGRVAGREVSCKKKGVF
jgi:hypothetical protein